MKFSEVYTKILLTIIALCLVALVLQTGIDVFSSSAEARTSKSSKPNVDVFHISTLPAEDIKEVITLGDQHTFLIQLRDSVKVYRVDWVLD